MENTITITALTHHFPPQKKSWSDAAEDMEEVMEELKEHDSSWKNNLYF